MSGAASKRQAALALYQSLLRYRGNLAHTDRAFYGQRVRQEFERNRRLKDPARIDACIATGQKFLKNDPLE